MVFTLFIKLRELGLVMQYFSDASSWPKLFGKVITESESRT